MFVLWLYLFELLIVTHGRWVIEMEDSNLFEGDMILTSEQKDVLSNHGYAALRDVAKLWQSRYIPYMISADINENPTAKSNVMAAMKEIEKKTCLKFYHRRNEMSYLHFYKGGGCNSPVGMRIGGNLISLSPGCWAPGSVAHEICHSLGFYHEQARPDRDDYVTIKWENIRSGSTHNFNKQSIKVINSRNTPYDYKSVMHYSKTAFGNGRVTIKTKDPSVQDIIGQRDGLSDIDALQLNIMYKCVPTPTGSGKTPSRKPTITDVHTTKRPDVITTSKPDNGCTDKVSNCKSMIANCASDDRWRSFMKTYCKRTCNFC